MLQTAFRLSIHPSVFVLKVKSILVGGNNLVNELTIELQG